MRDQFINLVIGILGGIISGVMVTLYYRRMDEKRDLLRYFDNFQAYIRQFIASHTIEEMEDFSERILPPKQFDWIKPSEQENKIISDAILKITEISDLLGKRKLELQSIAEGCGDRSEVDCEAEYWYKITNISMWTITALCHDLGYPLEKAEQILDKTRKMMREFVPNPNVWNNFGYSGTQDSINEYVLKFISTKMKEKTSDEKADEQTDAIVEKEYLGRIQPKYYLKYAKSLESFQHGIISTIIIYKMLLYFLESDFNLNDDYIYKNEDARQFYIRREILRAIAAHTCPDAYNIHITSFSSLLFLCDEFQEWGRRTWNELYTGLKEDSISLEIEKFSSDEIDIQEKISLESVEDIEIIVQNISRVFDRQYSLYKTTFRDGQYTAKRDFSLTKTMKFTLPKNGAQTREIIIKYGLPKSDASYFNIDLSNVGTSKEDYKKKIESKISKQMYYRDLKID